MHFMDAYPEIREFMEQANKDKSQWQEELVQKTGKKQGDLADIRRLTLADKKSSLEKESPKKNELNYWESLISTEPKQFDSPSSMTEDSDEKDALRDRGFKLGYKDLGVDMRTTTAEEATSMTDSATESAVETTPEQDIASEEADKSE